MAQVHYEIFRRQGKSGWSLAEAVPQRDVALARAKELHAQGAAAVRVVKETFQPDTGDYLSLTIFEDGKLEVQKNKNKKTEDIESPVPCFKPDDLYSYHARATLTRVIADWLSRQKLTATELLHSAVAIERFEATGTTYQHAIQKIAVAQASDSEVSVQQIVKQLNELCTTAINRVYKDEKRGLFPNCNAGAFGDLARGLADRPDGRYVLNGALAKYLADVKNWDEKLRRLLALMPEIPAEGPGHTLLFTALDSLIAEMLNGTAALADLLGSNEDLGHALLNLVDLFLGRTVNAAEGSGRGLNELALHFSKDGLPEARTAIAQRMLAELRGMKRLCPSSQEAELRMLRKLANQLVLGQGRYLSHEDLINAFTERSKRLVTHEVVGQFLQKTKTSDERVDVMLLIEENIIGAENKRVLATFIMPIISAHGFEGAIGSPDSNALQRLKRLTELQTRVLRSGFQELQKNQIATILDAVAVRIEDKAHVLAGVEAKFANPVHKAEALIKLNASGLFTQGDLATKARRALLGALAKPGFLTGYVAERMQNKSGTPPDREVVIAELVNHLEKFGIAAEDGMRAIAA